jgi:hypothetical protein
MIYAVVDRVRRATHSPDSLRDLKTTEKLSWKSEETVYDAMARLLVFGTRFTKLGIVIPSRAHFFKTRSTGEAPPCLCPRPRN